MATILHDSIGLLIDVSLKAALLAAAAGAGLLIFRVRNSNVRHRVWTAVLLGMLLMPLLTQITPGVPLPTWLYPRLRIGGGDAAAHLVVKARADVPSSSTSTSVPNTQLATSQPSPTIENETGAANSTPDLSGDDVTGKLAERPISVVIPTRASDPTPPWLIGVAIAYLIGAAALIVRLASALGQIRKLMRSARRVSLASAHQQWIGQTIVRESATVRVPLTVGWLRPSILLPTIGRPGTNLC